MSERNRPIAGYFGDPWDRFIVKWVMPAAPSMPYDPFGGADSGVIKRQQAFEATT
jgi:hypothetical protein